MRQILIGVLLFVFGPIAALVLDRYMSAAPEWLWRAASFGSIAAGAAIAALSGPIYARIQGESGPIISTLLVSVGVAIIAAAGWWFFGVPNTSGVVRMTLAPSARGELMRLIDVGKVRLEEVRWRDENSDAMRHARELGQAWVVETRHVVRTALGDKYVERLADRSGISEPIPNINQSELWTTMDTMIRRLSEWVEPPTDAIGERDVDEAELANTTNLQEAILIDASRSSAFGRSELQHLMNVEYVKNPANLLALPIEAAYEDLFARGLLQRTKLAAKPVEPAEKSEGATVVGNVFLTAKGRSLTQDLLYLRQHPEIKVSRPVDEAALKRP